MIKSKRFITIIIMAAISLAGCGSSKSANNLPKSPLGNSSSNSNNTTLTGTAEYNQNGNTVTKSNETISASNSNESGVKVSKKGILNLSNSKIITSGKTSSEDSSNFYGLNAVVLAESGSKINLKKDTINTSGEGANAIFSTGMDSKINAADINIKTTNDSSRGLDATMKGSINATNVNISTEGTHCAAIATDKGNGSVTVKGGTMLTSGKDSPGIYSIGRISVSDATIKSINSEAAVVEGKNSITAYKSNISGGKNNGIMLYQSSSGNTETGTASFTMTDGSLTSNKGALFFVTNTDADVNLTDVSIKNNSDTLISAETSEKWGINGQNGGKLNFTTNSENLKGKVICDNISSIIMTLKNNTAFTGSINTDNKLKNVKINLDNTSKWIVNENSYVQVLADSDRSLANIKSNGHTIYYDSTSNANNWLENKTITLNGNGKLTPAK